MFTFKLLSSIHPLQLACCFYTVCVRELKFYFVFTFWPVGGGGGRGQESDWFAHGTAAELGIYLNFPYPPPFSPYPPFPRPAIDLVSGRWNFILTSRIPMNDSTLFILYLSKVLCLSVCHNCFCLWNAELFFMFFAINLTKDTRRGFTDEGIRDGEICREKVEGGVGWGWGGGGGGGVRMTPYKYRRPLRSFPVVLVTPVAKHNESYRKWSWTLHCKPFRVS